jgi:hypothetical protein
VNPAAHERFEDALRSLAARLELPQPARSRVVLEIAGDLEDAYEYHRHEGLDDDAARDAALARFDLSDEALAELVAVHSTWARRFMDSMSERGRSRFERVALALVMGFVVALAGLRLAGAGLLEHVGAAAVPSVALTLTALAVAAHKAWRLWLTGDHRIRQLHRGLPEILIAAAASLGFGMAGFWFELHRMFSAAMAAVPAAGADLGSSAPDLYSGLLHAFAAGNAGMLGAVACCMAWWLLVRKVQRIERAETEVFIEF